MSNYKDNNADLGNQTIEGTEPPTVSETIIVMPGGASDSPAADDVPTAAELDAQLNALINNDEPIVVEPVIVPPAENIGDLEAQLENLMKDPEPKSTPDNGENLDEQLAAMLKNDEPSPAAEMTEAELDAKLDELLFGKKSEQSAAEQQTPEQPIITPPQPEQSQAAEQAVITPPVAEQQTPEQPIIAPIQPEQTQAAEQTIIAPPAQDKQSPPPAEQTQSGMEGEAQAMMEQARRIMEQAQQAQMQATAQMQAAHIQAQVTQATQQAVHSQQPVVQPANADNGSAEAARLMIQQAQMMLKQAQDAQLQAQRAAQEAQLQAQVVQATRSANQTPVQITDPYALKEVDRLKAELDSMRDLVNKLTFSLAQNQNGGQAIKQTPVFTAPPDYEQYKKIESELDSMRRQIIEKDLRDREKELDRRQKEAENNVKDIRPEMIQMSDTRDVAPVMPAPNIGAFGSDFIPIAEGVFYSTKNKQVYVMTPASNAVASSPTIEKTRRVAAPAKKKKAASPARASAKRRAALSRKRHGSAPMSRRRPPSRPTHR